jgi:glycosyltransferase involved in cell wall biosynthesis
MSSIALVMIARDEARCIARCLDSVRGCVDEMWVLDTGSTDATAAIAQARGARVVPFVWCDDFARARNAALALTGCDWRVVLDADEWLAGGGDVLGALRAQAADWLGLLPVTSLIEAQRDGVHEAPSWLPRLLPRGVAYSGRVHEQPQSALPRRRLNLRVLHDGYLPAQMSRKGARNQHLLQLALQADPHDGYLNYQLGKDHEVHGRFVQAEPFYARAHGSVEAQAVWKHDLVLRWLFTLKKLRRFEPALALAQAELPQWAHSPDFFFTLGDLLLDWAAAEPARAGELLPMIDTSWRRAVDIGEAPHLADTVRGRGSYLASHNLSVLHAGLGDETEAQAWRERATAQRAAHA